MFLLDGSDDLRSRFPAILEFVSKVVESLDLDLGNDQVAVVQYSNNAAVNLYLNSHKTRDTVLAALKNLRPKGGRPQYIGEALEFVKNSVFVSNAGSRRHEGAHQILILMAGGRSRDSPRGPAASLKTTGVVVFAIGSRMSNMVELQAISSDPNNVDSVPDLTNLSNIQQSLITRLAQIRPTKEKTIGKTYNLIGFRDHVTIVLRT